MQCESVILSTITSLCLVSSYVSAQDDNFYERPGVSSSEIALARGYTVSDVYLDTPDGYRLHLVHITNPLIEQNSQKRVPILFIHGILEDSNIFVINSFDIRPRNWSNWLLTNSSNLNQIYGDPSSKSLPFLALNFGHEVWLLDRRGAPGSQTRAKGARPAARFRRQAIERDASLIEFGALASAPGGLVSNGDLLNLIELTLDSSFWNFSFDEQAEFDFPLVLNHISEQSGGQRVAVVGHSAGGLVPLMTLSERPELAQNVSSAILWSPGYSLGLNDIGGLLVFLRPFLETYKGPLPPAFTSTQIQTLLGLICAAKPLQRTLCESIADLILGESGGKEPIRPEYLNSLLYPSSTPELAQLLQGIQRGNKIYKYNYGSSSANEAKYGQAEPPLYDLSRVTLPTISLYVGSTDFIVSEADVRFSSDLLTVPHRFHLIDTTFNHQGYFYHDNTAHLVIVPSLQEIQSFASA